MKRFYTFTLLFLICSCKPELEKVSLYYPNGNLKTTFYVDRDSLRQGESYYYNEKGTLTEKVYYADDTIDGNYYLFYENGNLELKGKTKKGVKFGKGYRFREDGKLALIQWFNIKGQTEKVINFNEQGQYFKTKGYFMLNNDRVHATKELNIDENGRKTLNIEKSNFVRLKRKNNDLWVDLISKNSQFIDSVNVIFLKEFTLKTFEYFYKGYRKVKYGGKRNFKVELKGSDFINGKCRIFIETSKRVECDPKSNNKGIPCYDVEQFYIQFNRDDYDIKDNLNPIYP